MDEYTKLLYGLAGIGVAGFVGYVLRRLADLQDQLHRTRLDMQQRFATNESIDELREKVDRSIELLFEICGKLGVHTRRG